MKTAPPTEAAFEAGPALPGFPIVGLGASAGGLAAFQAFFSGFGSGVKPGMAFVLVQHLAPDRGSMLAELIQRVTEMQVLEVQDGVVVQVNCVYIIPPDRDMAFLHGALHLLQPSVPRGHRLPIDYLFRSLAQDQHELAIGIVLSGNGSDGTVGLRAIKAEGGMVMAQLPASSEFDGMPRSAVDTGMVDFQLPPAEMPAQLMAYVAHAFGKLPKSANPTEPQAGNALSKVLVLLRDQTGHDFAHYKPNTIRRRIERRMAVHQIDAMEGYVKFLQQTPPEAEALFYDLLIGVTHFFRDPDAFGVLETQGIQQVFADKPAGGTVRAWIAGCSTGEEAYSMAILLQERTEVLRQSYKIQVFATDIDSRAIAVARAGVYPASIAADMSPERLARFFTAEPDGNAYRVNKSLRDMLVFCEQDLIKDPPFSKLDLISCRNLLIYLGPELQKKVMSLFHYALHPAGVLFLGTSETVGEMGDAYVVLDRKSKLYARKEDHLGAKRAAVGRPASPPVVKGEALPLAPGKVAATTQLSLRALTEQTLLLHIDKVAALVNGHGDILFLHGRAGMYLEPHPGEAGVNNILKMAREGLRRALTTNLHKAASSKEPVHTQGLRVKNHDHYTAVDLSVLPVAMGAGAAAAPLYLVVLEEGWVAASLPAATGLETQGGDTHAHIAALHEELQAKEEYLHAANEELETSNEELKSSNEEMQSVNEELQSTNEELETSKEELQSVNEELSTVNNELQTKVGDLSRANNDMNNLLAGTGIGTIFLDPKLHLLRFTPAATLLVNLIASDVGRPVGHIVSNLVGYDSLVADAAAVLKTLVPKEVDVQTSGGQFFTMRILPYRTLDNVVEGAVITFVDITEVVRAREALRNANALLRLAVVVRDAHDAITVQDRDGRITAWNPGATRMYGWTEAQALTMNVRDRIPKALQDGALDKVHQLSKAHALEPYLTQRLAQDGTVVDVSLTSTALINASGEMYAIATTERGRDSTATPATGGHHGNAT